MINVDMVLLVIDNMDYYLNKLTKKPQFDRLLSKGEKDKVQEVYVASMFYQLALKREKYALFNSKLRNKETEKLVIKNTRLLLSKYRDYFTKVPINNLLNFDEFEEFMKTKCLKRGFDFVNDKSMKLNVLVDKTVKIVDDAGKGLLNRRGIIENIYKCYYDIHQFSARLYLRELIDAGGRFFEISGIISSVYLAYEKLIDKLVEERVDDNDVLSTYYNDAMKTISNGTNQEYVEGCLTFVKFICKEGSVLFEILEERTFEEYFIFLLLVDNHLDDIKKLYAKWDAL